MPERTIRFNDEQMRWFAAASGDINPLHLDAQYAAQTWLGQPVVFGMLGALAAFAALDVPASQSPTELRLQFHKPIYTGIEYRIVFQLRGTDANARILDGETPLLTLRVRFAPVATDVRTTAATAVWPRMVAAVHEENSLTAGVELQGRYWPDAETLNRVALAVGSAGPIPETHFSALACLLWASYFVGMELPGQQALFLEARFQFPIPATPSVPFSYRVAVDDYSPGFRLLTSSFQLEAGGNGVLTTGRLSAFVRPHRFAADTELLAVELPASKALSGKVALVTGGSRGLGAAIVRALSSQGATVYINYRGTHDRAQQLLSSLEGLPGSARLLAGDAGTAEWTSAASAHILAETGRLDFLILNACPAPLPLAFDSAALDRFHSFVSKGLALVSHPLAAFLPALRKSGGAVCLVSSAFAEEAPADFPQYVALKCSAEGLLASVAHGNPQVAFLSVRPGRLKTDMTNPLVDHDASPPEIVAAKIVRNLVSFPTSGSIHQI